MRKSKGIYFTVMYTLKGGIVYVGNKPTMTDLLRDIIENSDNYPNADGRIVRMGV